MSHVLQPVCIRQMAETDILHMRHDFGFPEEVDRNQLQCPRQGDSTLQSHAEVLDGLQGMN